MTDTAAADHGRHDGARAQQRRLAARARPRSRSSAADETDGSGIRQIAYSATGAQAIAPKVVAGEQVDDPGQRRGRDRVHATRRPTTPATPAPSGVSRSRSTRPRRPSPAPAPTAQWHGANVSLVCSSARGGLRPRAAPRTPCSASSTTVAGRPARPRTRRPARAASATSRATARTSPRSPASRSTARRPTLKLPRQQTVDATAPTGEAVTYSATATDGVDPAPVVTCLPASGATMAHRHDHGQLHGEGRRPATPPPARSR